MFDNGVTGVGRNDLITRQNDGNPLAWSNLIARIEMGSLLDQTDPHRFRMF
jgi:hypothetical protein